MSIKSVGAVNIHQMGSKTFNATRAAELDKQLNEWLSANAGRQIVSMDSHANEYGCWVVILYKSV
ncbi:MAG: hypothetical protein IPG59_13450 [Candidatus Melainabacteria bacterium]|nr:MAG: hypothetical protein IPG59_13450 [Candidatus Melainabacteria bacterium]